MKIKYLKISPAESKFEELYFLLLRNILNIYYIMNIKLLKKPENTRSNCFVASTAKL